MPVTSDYIAKVSPLQIGVPYEVEVSPWPKQPFWVTPVKWQVLQVIATNPLPGIQLSPLPAIIDTIIAIDFKDTTSIRFVGLVRVDGLLFTHVGGGYRQSQSKWSMEAGGDSYASESDLIQAIQNAAQNSNCGRRDILTASRIAAEAERASGMAAPVVPSVPPDSGSP